MNQFDVGQCPPLVLLTPIWSLTFPLFLAGHAFPVLGRKWYSPRCMVNDMKLVSPSSLSEVAMIAVSWCIGTEVEVEDHSYLDIYALLGDIQPKFYDRGAPSDLDPVERLTRGKKCTGLDRELGPRYLLPIGLTKRLWCRCWKVWKPTL